MTPRRAFATVVALVTLAGGAQAQKPLLPRDARTGTAEISGIVVSGDAAARAVRDALVLVAGTDVGVIRVTSTDASGRFAFTGLPEGRFLVAAGKPAYIAVLHGARRAGGPGAVIALGAGQKVADLRVPLAPGAAIAGRVTDEHGDPIAGLRVRVMQRRLVGDEVTLNGDLGDPAGATTDDRGTYRIYNLPPGDYAVAVQARILGGGDVRVLSAADVDADPDAAPRPSPPPASAGLGHAPMYYPASPNAADSQVVTLAPGQERAGIDLKTRVVRFARVDGVVAAEDGAPPQNMQVSIRPRGLDSAGVVLSSNTTRPGPDGRFNFNGLPPGDYTISARTLPPPVAPDRTASPPRALWGVTPVTVNGENVANVRVRLQPSLTIAGRVVFDGLARPPRDVGNVRVGLRATPASGGPPLPEPASIDAEGRFTLNGVLPGKYWLYALVPATDPATQIPDWVTKSAAVDGHDALDLPFELAPDAQGVAAVLTLTDDIQEIIGVVSDRADKPVHNVSVVVFPVDRRLWFPQSRRIAARQTDGEGAFVFGLAAGLPPGEYYIAATSPLAPNEQFDPALLDALAPTAERLSLGEGATKTVNLRQGQRAEGKGQREGKGEK